MKKIFKGLIFAFVGVIALTLASCGKEEHQPEVGWSRDSSSHWHTCSHCDEQLDLEVHQYNEWVKDAALCQESRKCNICGFVMTRTVDHTWGEWTAQEDGSMAKTCTHCGETESVIQYYVRGSHNNWGNDGLTAADTLVIDYEKMEATLTVTLTAGGEFKVATSDWSKEFNIETVEAEEGLFSGTGNIVVNETAEYKVVVSGLGGNDHKCTITQLCVHTYVWTEVADKPCHFTGVCSKCQATGTKVEHTLGEWVVEAGKTCDFVKSCSKCDYKETKVEHEWYKPEGSTLEVCKREGCDAVNVLDYYIKGSFLETAWAASEEGKFAVADDGKSSTFYLVVEAGDEFKVGSKDGWEFDYSKVTFNVKGFEEGKDDKGNNNGNIKVSTAGTYVVTVSGLDTATHTVTIGAVELYVRGDAVGTWDAVADNKLVYDKETDSASITIEIADISKGFKIAPATWDILGNAFNLGFDAEGKIVAAGDSGHIKVTEAANWVVKVSGIAAGEPVVTITKGEGEVAPVVVPVPDMWVRGSFDEGWATLADYKLQSGVTYVKGAPVDNLNITVYLAKDTQFKVGSEDFGYSFGENADYAEGLFEIEGGNLKVKADGWYTITILGLDDKSQATCSIVVDAYKTTVAAAAALGNKAPVQLSGTIKIAEEVVSLVDGEDEIVVTNLGHIHNDDVVTIKGKVVVDGTSVSINASKIISAETDDANELNLELTKVTELSQLVDGVKVVMACGDYVLAESASADVKTYRNINFSASHLDAHQSIVTLVKSGENWLLKTGENEYLYYVKSGVSGYKNNVSTGNVTDETAQWKIAISEGVVTIENVGTAGRLLQFNISSVRVAAYLASSKQVNPDLYIAKEIVAKETYFAGEDEYNASHANDDSIPLGFVWKEIFTLGEAGNNKTWKVTANNKNVLDVNGESYKSEYRLQSQGQNELFIDLSEKEGTATFQLFVLSGTASDVTRTITLMDGETEVEVFTINQADGWENSSVLNTMVFEFTVQCGKSYELVFSNGINIHGINMLIVK